MYKTSFVPFSDIYFENKEKAKHTMTFCHYHDTYEIYLQTFENRKLFLNGYSYNIQPYDLCFFKPFELHRIESSVENTYSCYILNFSDSHLDLLLTDVERNLLLNKISSGVYHLTPYQYKWIMHIYQSLQYTYDKPGFLSDKFLVSHVLQLLCILKDCSSENQFHIDQSEIRPELMCAIEYINKNYQLDISLDEVAQNVHMSKCYFSRLFSNTLGFGFLEYLNNIRLSKAHQMLVETKYSINEIAQQTGFHSATHLSRIFAATYGTTPTDFRKNM